jgi:hypothetical protein
MKSPIFHCGLFCGLSLLLASCASIDSTPTPTLAAAENVAPIGEDLTLAPVVVQVQPAPLSQDDIVCKKEIVTGTHQIREVCESRRERATQRRSAQEWLRSGGFRGGGTVVGGGRR